MQFKVISFYCEPNETSRYYTKHARRIFRQFKKFGVDCYIEKLENAGGYYLNCRRKAQFIKDCVDKFQVPVLWIDIDSAICDKPSLESIAGEDFGAIERRRHIEYPIYAHCLFFNNTAEGLMLLDKWCEKCNTSTDEKVGDHSLLVKTIRELEISPALISERFADFGISPPAIKRQTRVDRINMLRQAKLAHKVK